MSDIEVTVRVPADLEVSECLNASNKRLWSGDTAFTFAAKPGAGSWTCDLGRQIAAAVEARKPRPPLFGVGDVVEWYSGNVFSTHMQRGIVTEVYEADVTGPANYKVSAVVELEERELTLVRRAEK